MFNYCTGDRQIKELLVECKNTEQGCSWTGPLRDKVDHVIKSCDYTMVICKHEDIGCTQKATKKRIREHEEDDNVHFPLLLGAVKKVRGYNNVANGDGKIIKVDKYQMYKENNSKVRSEPFYSHPDGYMMFLLVAPNGIEEAKDTHVSVGVFLTEGPNDKDLPWPFAGTVSVTLLNQKLDDYHHELIEEIEKKEKIQSNSFVYIRLKFISQTALTGKPNKQYLSNDTVYFKVTVETKEHKPWLHRDSILTCSEYEN